MKFSEVIGQQDVKNRLMQMVAEHRVPHALLFCGPEGCGKMAMALAFASYLLGEREEDAEDDSPQTRRATSMLRKWEHPDLHFTYPTIKLASMGDHSPVSLDFVKEWREMYFILPETYTTPAGETAQFSHAGRACASVVLWMGIWWFTEAVPIAVTALLPIVIFPLFGITTPAEALNHQDSLRREPRCCHPGKRCSQG